MNTLSFFYTNQKIKYTENYLKDDMREMEEERANMREHVMKEVDYDKDGAISIAEFLKYTGSQESV